MKKSDSHRPTTLSKIKKRLWHRCFPVNFAKFLRKPFLQNNFLERERDVNSFNSIPRSIIIFKAEYSRMDQIKFAVDRPQKPYKICSRETCTQRNYFFYKEFIQCLWSNTSVLLCPKDIFKFTKQINSGKLYFLLFTKLSSKLMSLCQIMSSTISKWLNRQNIRSVWQLGLEQKTTFPWQRVFSLWETLRQAP